VSFNAVATSSQPPHSLRNSLHSVHRSLCNSDTVSATASATAGFCPQSLLYRSVLQPSLQSPSSSSAPQPITTYSHPHNLSCPRCIHRSHSPTILDPYPLSSVPSTLRPPPWPHNGQSNCLATFALLIASLTIPTLSRHSHSLNRLHSLHWTHYHNLFYSL
jgi:hypothetical protein